MPYDQFLIGTVRDYNPDTGVSNILTYTGTEAEMATVRTYWEVAGQGAPVGYGYKTNLVEKKEGFYLTVRLPDEILFVDSWNLDSENVSVPLIWDYKVAAHLGFDVGSGDLATRLAQDELYFRAVSFILQAVTLYQTGTAYTGDPKGIVTLVNSAVAAGVNWVFPEYYDIVFQILREGPNSVWKRPVLKRNRTIPVGLFSVRTRLVGVATVYTTSALIDATSMPVDIQDQISTVDNGLLTAPPNTIWGWKLRRDDSEVQIGFGKYKECRDWVFDRWSTITHEIVT